jgi:hypothetical protein
MCASTATTRERPRDRFERDERFLLQPLAQRGRTSLVLEHARAPRRPSQRRRVPLVAVERRPLAVYARLAGGPHEERAPSRRDRLRHMLADLKMPGALEALDAILHGVDGGRSRRRSDRAAAPRRFSCATTVGCRPRCAPAGCPRSSSSSDFDFTFQPSLKREQIESLHELGFVERRENVDLPRPARRRQDAPRHQPRDRRRAERTTRLLRHPGRPDHVARGGAGRRSLQARLKVLTHPALLVVDEIGYLPISRTGAMLFFQLMTRRYEHASTVLTSNKGFEEWGEIFGDEVMAAALIDRLVHHCHLVTSAATATACGSTPSSGSAACPAGAGAGPGAAAPSGGGDDLRLVPSSICQIFNRRNCQIFGRR